MRLSRARASDPGIGVLTWEAAQRAQKVIAVEIDQNLIPILGETLREADNIEIVNQDILKTDLNTLIEAKKAEAEAADMPLAHVRVIGNLPYYITTPIIMKLLEDGVAADSITVMMQKEVAERMRALPGTKAYGALSVAVQYYCEAENVVTVPASCFVPQPKVTSAVVRMDRRAAPPASVDDKKLFFRTVRAAFAQRRKTLSNALRSGFSELDRAAIESAMEETGLPPAVRGETLSIAQFAALSNALLRKFDK